MKKSNIEQQRTLILRGLNKNAGKVYNASNFTKRSIGTLAAILKNKTTMLKMGYSNSHIVNMFQRGGDEKKVDAIVNHSGILIPVFGNDLLRAMLQYDRQGEVIETLIKNKDKILQAKNAGKSLHEICTPLYLHTITENRIALFLQNLPQDKADEQPSPATPISNNNNASDNTIFQDNILNDISNHEDKDCMQVEDSEQNDDLFPPDEGTQISPEELATIYAEEGKQLSPEELHTFAQCCALTNVDADNPFHSAKYNSAEESRSTVLGFMPMYNTPSLTKKQEDKFVQSLLDLGPNKKLGWEN